MPGLEAESQVESERAGRTDTTNRGKEPRRHQGPKCHNIWRGAFAPTIASSFSCHTAALRRKKKPSKTPSGLWEKLICISIFATMAGMLGGLRRDAQYLKSYCESLCRKHHILHLPRITDACFQTFLHIGCEVLLWGVTQPPSLTHLRDRGQHLTCSIL